VALFEYVVRVVGRPDETLISDRNGLVVGDRVKLRGKRWRVLSVGRLSDRREGARILLVPDDQPRPLVEAGSRGPGAIH
jgi:hypothetical protein